MLRYGPLAQAHLYERVKETNEWDEDWDSKMKVKDMVERQEQQRCLKENVGGRWACWPVLSQITLAEES